MGLFNHSTRNERIEENIDNQTSLHSILQLRPLHFLASVGFRWVTGMPWSYGRNGRDWKSMQNIGKNRITCIYIWFNTYINIQFNNMLKCSMYTMTCNTYWKNCGCSFHCPNSLRCQFVDYLIGMLLRMTPFWDHLGSARGISLYNLETLIKWNYMMDSSLIIAALSQWHLFENRCHLKKNMTHSVQ